MRNCKLFCNISPLFLLLFIKIWHFHNFILLYLFPWQTDISLKILHFFLSKFQLFFPKNISTSDLFASSGPDNLWYWWINEHRFQTMAASDRSPHPVTLTTFPVDTVVCELTVIHNNNTDIKRHPTAVFNSVSGDFVFCPKFINSPLKK